MTVNVKNAANTALGAVKAQVVNYVLPFTVGTFVCAGLAALIGKKFF